MRRAIWTVMTVVGLTGGGAAAQTTTYPAKAFFETTSFGLASDPYAFSPDGGTLLVSSDENGVFNAYAVDLTTGGREALTESASDASFAVSFMPNGGGFLYTADQGGNELNHLYLGGVGDAPRDLTPGDELKASFVGWIEDGAAFVVSTNERDPQFFDAYRYDAETFERRMMFQNDEGFASLVISRDGNLLAATKERTSADSDIYLVDLADGGEPRLITEHEGNVAHGVYDFTPDGEKLVYATDEHGEFTQAWTYDVQSGEKAPLIEADWDVAYVGFSPSGRYRVHGVNADASTEVTVTDLRTGEAVPFPTGLPEGDVGSVRFSRNEQQIAFTVDSSRSPSDVFIAELGAGEARRLTDALNPAINAADLVEAEVVRYESYDGLAIPAIQYKPKSASAENPVPAIVLVHGGPGGQSRTGYSAMIQHLVNHGYAVLAANNRGSSGYGKTFYHMDDRKHGDVDLRDIVAARGYLEGLPWVDGDKVAVMGGSYGGYMTMAALTFHPEAFDAGVNIFGVTNWVRTLESIPAWWGSFREALYDEMGDPATDAERHRAISPLFHAENVTKPVLIVQGSNDPRVLQVESDEMVEALRENGVPVEYVLFDDEGHGFLKRDNRIEASEAYLAFLDQYLKGKGEESREGD
ncbi:S9 family peptidase [Parvularcula dongshanensis]|uniref:Acyl-peptide hydrolase n=1 Tax=Parvularcula dongshanensis TaxID=1173995 RepID=A0A840I7P9_9PROT|nr:S9 family peptidase [Parvularcula dongshanensis]MBB4660355.1 dipeptidyl aminopeptidase/acylaminoacyl peptidase [Parvularcula dongshanensis]